MASIPIEEYLASAYHPDVDYVEDHIEERNAGEKEHGKLQFRIAILLERQRTLIPFIATRLMISPTRYRVPDVCAYDREPDESVFTQAPALCIEVLSPEDRLSRIVEVAQDYLAKGVPTVWVLDPLKKKAYIVDAAAGLREVSGQIATGDQRVILTLAEIFSDVELL